MLQFFKFLPHIVIFSAGVAFGGFAENLRQSVWVHPDIISETEAKRDLLCLTITSEATRIAVAQENQRQQKAADWALREFAQRAKERAFTRSEIIEKLQTENHRYAKELEANGRSCPLDADAIDWLRH